MSSRTHKDFQEETKDIEAPVKSEFKSTTYAEIKHLFGTMAEPNSFDVHTQFFLLLDDQSPKDRKIVITQKIVLPLNSDGTFLSRQAEADGEKPVKIKVKWKRHRVPYEETGTTVALLDAQGGLEFEPYLEESKEELMDAEES